MTDKNGWTDERAARALELLGEEIAAEITPHMMEAATLREDFVYSRIECACEAKLIREWEYTRAHYKDTNGMPVVRVVVSDAHARRWGLVAPTIAEALITMLEDLPMKEMP